MNILSESDFCKLKSSGMLYVLLQEYVNFDGTYESYLKEIGMGLRGYVDSGDGTAVENYFSAVLPSVTSYPPMPKCKPYQPAPLMPRDQAISIRIMDIADAIIRYASVYKSVPVDWLEELWQLNADLEVLNIENEDEHE